LRGQKGAKTGSRDPGKIQTCCKDQKYVESREETSGNVRNTPSALQHQDPENRPNTDTREEGVSMSVDRCWALTGRDITAVTDQACEQAITKAFGQIDKEEVKVGDNWVGKCWLTLTAALHDDHLVKVAHVPRGHIHSLLTEISLALVLNSAEEVQPLRLELYGATMVKDGNSDLQTYIVYLLERVKKLAFHKKAVDDEELISIFLKGLHPIFQPLQVHFAIPGTLSKKFDEVVAIVRRYSTTPVVAAKL